MIHPSAKVHRGSIVDSGVSIGESTFVSAYSHIVSGATIGCDCSILDHVLIESDVHVGDRVTVKGGVQIGQGVRLEDEVYVGSNTTITDNKRSPLRQDGDKNLVTYICRGAFIGANATLLSGIRIGAGSIVEAGAVVASNVPPKAIVSGNPAKIVGYRDAVKKQGTVTGDAGELERSSVEGVQLYSVHNVKDLRGDLAALEWDKDLPFNPKRIFFVYNVPSDLIRGEHAHKVCHQFLLCIHGSIAVVLDDGNNREEFLLSDPQIGIHIPPKVWGTQYKYSSGAVLVVLASHEYDAGDYIRDYEDYLTFVTL